MLRMFPLQSSNQVSNFHIIWYGNTITGHPTNSVSFHTINNNMADKQTS